jgi:hypothetical protein
VLNTHDMVLDTRDRVRVSSTCSEADLLQVSGLTV